ncbi:type II secretion system protein [Kamptonema cortianum]|nr:type II secretion system protein [Geitlerinema splendidum]MDK3158792.1 type II secretion system protein [Kamptonema cortianum]
MSSNIQSARCAFTLIELLVVIAIVSSLTAILFPIFARAKIAAKATQSASNLRQLTTAWTIYATDYDDTCMRDLTQSGLKTFYWWGSWDGNNFQPHEGLLHPYTKSDALGKDPLLNAKFRSALGETGFAYNYSYLSPTDYVPPSWHPIPKPVSMSQIQESSRTIVFGTSARINNWSTSTAFLEANSYLEPPSTNYPTLHARASSSAIVSWADTHITRIRPTFRQGVFGYGFQGHQFKRESLGDALPPGCQFGQSCQDDLFSLAKVGS